MVELLILVVRGAVVSGGGFLVGKGFDKIVKVFRKMK